MSKEYPYRYDNCKDCVARCPHAGKDRKFVYDGFKSCKIVKKPHLLDRSAWEPCAKCRSCFSCAHVVESVRDSTSACFLCEHMDNFKPVNFCSACGRPLTNATWDMLEKRLENAK